VNFVCVALECCLQAVTLGTRYLAGQHFVDMQKSRITYIFMHIWIIITLSTHEFDGKEEDWATNTSLIIMTGYSHSIILDLYVMDLPVYLLTVDVLVCSWNL